MADPGQVGWSLVELILALLLALLAAAEPALGARALRQVAAASEAAAPEAQTAPRDQYGTHTAVTAGGPSPSKGSSPPYTALAGIIIGSAIGVSFLACFCVRRLSMVTHTRRLAQVEETVQRDREAAAADDEDASVALRKQLAPVTVIVMPDSTISFAVELTKEGDHKCVELTTVDVDTDGSAHGGSHHSGRAAAGILYPVPSGTAGHGTDDSSGGGGSTDDSSGGAIPVDIRAQVAAQTDTVPGSDIAAAGPSGSGNAAPAVELARCSSGSGSGRTPNFFVGLRRSMGRNLLYGEPAEYWDSSPIEAAAARPTPARRSMRRQQSRTSLPAPLHEFVTDGGENQDSSTGKPAAIAAPATPGTTAGPPAPRTAQDPDAQAAAAAAAQTPERAGADSSGAVSSAGGSSKPDEADNSVAAAPAPSGDVCGELRRHFGSQDGAGTN